MTKLLGLFNRAGTDYQFQELNRLWLAQLKTMVYYFRTALHDAFEIDCLDDMSIRWNQKMSSFLKEWILIFLGLIILCSTWNQLLKFRIQFQLPRVVSLFPLHQVRHLQHILRLEIIHIQKFMNTIRSLSILGHGHPVNKCHVHVPISCEKTLDFVVELVCIDGRLARKSLDTFGRKGVDRQEDEENLVLGSTIQKGWLVQQ